MGITAEQSFEELIAPLEAGLLHRIYKKVGNRETAREIYHEVYLAGLLNLHTLRDINKFPGWISEITQNEIHTHWRNEQKKCAKETLMDIRDPLHVPLLFDYASPSSEETFLFEEESRQLAQAIESLEDTEKLVIKMAYYNQLPLGEIAEILNMSLSAVKMRKQRALKKLKARMEQQWELADENAVVR